MKNITTLLVFLMLSFPAILLSQEKETTSPVFKTEIIRNVSRMDIEGKVYKNVTVSLRSNSQGYYVGETPKVKVKIVNVAGGLIW